MRRVTVIAYGEVQSVGYREFVRKATLKKNISGFVRNLDTGEVEIVAEGREEDLEQFLREIRTNEYPIDVIDLHVIWSDATAERTRFEIIRGDRDHELFERMDVAGTLLYKIMNNTSSSLVKEDQMLDRQDQMLNKQDQMLNKQDQMLDKQDQMLNLQTETIGEIKGLRTDFKSYFDTEFSEIKRKLQSIENALDRAGIKV